MRLLPDGDVNVKFLENHWASITCGRSRTRIAGMSRESFPELPQMPEHDRGDPGEDAGLDDRADDVCDLDGGIALHAERRAAADEAGRHDDGGDRRPSPGVRAEQRRRMSGTIGQAVPRAGAEEGHGGDCETGATRRARTRKAIFAGDDNHLFFQVGQRLLITRKLTGNFPDYERVLPKDQHAHRQAAEGRDPLGYRARGAVRRRAVARHPRAVHATGEVQVFSSSVETGESEETCTSEYQGPDLEIGFNAQYLLDFLRAIPQEQVSFELKDQKSAGELRPAGEGIADQYRYVVMPMRI